ncbi:hypothetical protein Vau01_036880 [Virgisporangium aurantiacum]|uniref:Uncharacterized protein n=1 Tax=Virgisporangium aurantiacum TaxID=175570 RepID=A0A8J4E1N9_9ACTN|nr:hypothetical protein Vau01_036880 [Virgisporangium aurantiacum]
MCLELEFIKFSTFILWVEIIDRAGWSECWRLCEAAVSALKFDVRSRAGTCWHRTGRRHGGTKVRPALESGGPRVKRHVEGGVRALATPVKRATPNDQRPAVIS